MRRALLALAVACALPAQAADRSRAVRAEFQRANPCPSTGATRGRCDGWQVDHRLALCAGGIDHPSNLAWISVADHKIKSAKDVGLCRAQRAGFVER